MLVHIVTIIIGYASAPMAEVPATTWDLVTNYGGMLLAVAGTACLVMVVVTSIKAARRRLRYESWHLLHLYAYLGVGLAIPHQLWTGQEFLRSPAATVYWWTLWAAAAAAVLVWRLALPLWRSLRHGLRVTSVVRESSDVVSVYLTGRRLDRLPVRAGQFLNVRFLDGPGMTRANPFSLSARPGRSLRITAKALGDGSARLAHLRPGTRVLFEGPYGRLSSRARDPAQGPAGRRRRGHHPAPRAGRRLGLRARRGDPALPLHRRAAVRPGVRRPRRQQGLQVVHLPGRRSSPRLRPGAGRSGRRRARGAAVLGSRPRRPRRLPLRSDRPGRPASKALLAAAGLPRDHIHTESFGW